MADNIINFPEENTETEDIETNNNSNQIDSLIEEFKENRIYLKEMIKEIESIKSKIDNLIPETLDKRYAYLFEQRVKAAFQIFQTTLHIRQEISKSIKDEIELRRKIQPQEMEDQDIEKIMQKYLKDIVK